MADPVVASVAAILERHLGLAAGSVGTRVIEAAVHRRMESTQTPTETAYLNLITGDRRELGDLAEHVVVPETWFNRYPESFKQLIRWLPTLPRPTGQIRILSIPCSTGEEPYTIAMTLLDQGMPPGSFKVDAVDVSPRAVNYARVGHYGVSAFREAGPDAWLRHFTVRGADYEIEPRVRELVTFRTANLADPRFLMGEGPYHVIFCRNLFIYLTEEARRIAVTSIDRLLAPGGIVFMGHAEPLGLFDPRFKSAGPPQAFAFSRVEASGSSPSLQPVTVNTSGSGSVRTPTATSRLIATSTERTPRLDPPHPLPPPPLAQTTNVSELDLARSAADRGDFASAVELCQRYLDRTTESVPGWTLLGVILETAGQYTEAERAFTRALFLDPGYYDALIHMMAICQRRGDQLAVSNYRRRAEAVVKREGRG